MVNNCQQFLLVKCIEEPTHFTENPSSLIDLVLTSNRNIIISCGVGDTFFPQQVRYRCPVYGILNFSKPKSFSFVRNIWSYDRRNYDMLRVKASSVNWNELQDDDINVYANNINDTILELSKQCTCIPNKVIRVRSSDPPWITNSLKRHIRVRKRLYRKAKQTNDPNIWNKFRLYRNKTLSLIRKSKQSHTDNLKKKLTSEQLSSKDRWKHLNTLFHRRSPQAFHPSTIMT